MVPERTPLTSIVLFILLIRSFVAHRLSIHTCFIVCYLHYSHYHHYSSYHLYYDYIFCDIIWFKATYKFGSSPCCSPCWKVWWAWFKTSL